MRKGTHHPKGSYKRLIVSLCKRGLAGHAINGETYDEMFDIARKEGIVCLVARRDNASSIACKAKTLH